MKRVKKWFKKETCEDDLNGYMEESVEALEQALIGQRIVSAERTKHTYHKVTPAYTDCFGKLQPEREHTWDEPVFRLVLDSGLVVDMVEEGACCAYTELESFFLDPSSVDHMITGVGTTDGFQKWHIYADMGQVLGLGVDWSASNGYYGYGFTIKVRTIEEL